MDRLATSKVTGDEYTTIKFSRPEMEELLANIRELEANGGRSALVSAGHNTTAMGHLALHLERAMAYIEPRATCCRQLLHHCLCVEREDVRHAAHALLTLVEVSANYETDKFPNAFLLVADGFKHSINALHARMSEIQKENQ